MFLKGKPYDLSAKASMGKYLGQKFCRKQDLPGQKVDFPKPKVDFLESKVDLLEPKVDLPGSFPEKCLSTKPNPK